MKSVHEHVKEAARQAGLTDVDISALPFPRPDYQSDRDYVEGLCGLLENFHQSGVFEST
jgi:hypothetical protein